MDQEECRRSQPEFHREISLSRHKATAVQPISISSKQLISVGQLSTNSALPCVINPAVPGLQLSTWAQDNLPFLEEALSQSGGILFRGFNLNTQADFSQFLEAISVELMNYTEGATPRTHLAESIYTSTEFPERLSIAPHNELSYVKTWPMKIWFFCEVPPEFGGETPVVDVRKVYKLIAPHIRSTFEKKKWMLVRNYRKGFGLSWNEVFHTDDPAIVESYCQKSDIECEWISSSHLRTRQVRPAIHKHPLTIEELWFNHIAFWHESSLEPEFREMYLADFGEHNLPYNTYYGDGTPIDSSVIDEIREAYSASTTMFRWQLGDLLMLDNMLVAHGRRPYSGPRRILTAMGQPSISDISP